jgi:hypothetical protein
MSRIQLPFRSTEATDRLALHRCGTTWTRFGAVSVMERLSSHASCQNLSISQLPSIVMMEAWKNAEVATSSVTDNNDQEWDASIRWSQSQRNRSALPKSLRSRIPNPPRWRGRWTFFQASKHLPPWTMSKPVHRKAFIIFSRALITHGGKPMHMEM